MARITGNSRIPILRGIRYGERLTAYGGFVEGRMLTATFPKAPEVRL
jgi:hypothetical protein